MGWWVRGRYEAVFGPSNRVQQSHPARLRAWVSGQGLLAGGGRGKALNDQYKGGGQQLEFTPFLPTLLTWESSSAMDQRSHWQPRYWGESAGQQEMAEF